MPGQSAEAEAIFGWLAEELSPDTYVNIMGQYHPDGPVAARSRRATRSWRGRCASDEHRGALDLARAAGLRRIDQRAPHPRLRRRFSLPVL